MSKSIVYNLYVRYTVMHCFSGLQSDQHGVGCGGGVGQDAREQVRRDARLPRRGEAREQLLARRHRGADCEPAVETGVTRRKRAFEATFDARYTVYDTFDTALHRVCSTLF